MKASKATVIEKHNVRIKSCARNDHGPPGHMLKEGNATDAQLQQE